MEFRQTETRFSTVGIFSLYKEGKKSMMVLNELLNKKINGYAHLFNIKTEWDKKKSSVYGDFNLKLYRFQLFGCVFVLKTHNKDIYKTNEHAYLANKIFHI